VTSGSRPPRPRRSSGSRGVLRNPEFRALVLAQAASEIGDHFARVAVAGIVLDRSGSAFLSALAFVISFVPAVGGSLLLGPLADRLPRKGLLIACDLARAVLIAALALAAAATAPLWALLALLLAAEVFSAPFDAARSAVLPDVLPDPGDYLAGSGLCRVLFQANQVVGLAAGGAVVYLAFSGGAGGGGAEVALAVDAATFVLSALVLAVGLRARPAPAAAAGVPRSRLLADVAGGARLVFTDPLRRVFVPLGWLAGAALVAPEGVALAYAVEQGRPGLGGVLMATLPAGAAVGSFVVSRRGPAAAARAIRPLIAVGCAALLASGLGPGLYATFALWAVAGFCQAFLVPVMVVVNLTTPAERRGAVNGLAGAGFNAAMAGSFLAAGLAADVAGAELAVLAAGVVGLGLLAGAHLFWPTASLARALGPAPADRAEPVPAEAVRPVPAAPPPRRRP
jgi:MFS family permease